MATTNEVFDFGYRLKQLRQNRKLTQKGLAAKLGISKETVYRYESNLQEPSLKRAIKMAQILNTSLDYLTGLDDAYTFKVSGLNAAEYEVFNEFIRTFIQR